MKRAVMVVVMLMLAGSVLAQQPAPAPKPSGQPAPQTQNAAPPAPQGKRMPQAKTQAEYDAYKVATANMNDGAVMEKSADDFAAKFPDSELRVLLYQAAMRAYQNSNNSDKMSAMAENVLKLDPDDPEALVAAGEVIVERTHDTDLDKDQRWDKAQQYAQHALQTVETDVAIPPGTPQDKVDAYKNLLRSSSYSILGAIAFNREKYPDAEKYFHQSIDAYPSQPDPVVVLRLALSLDKQSRYGEALKEANKAVEMTQDGSVAGKLARQERDRLVQLTGGIPAAPSGNSPH